MYKLALPVVTLTFRESSNAAFLTAAQAPVFGITDGWPSPEPRASRIVPPSGVTKFGDLRSVLICVPVLAVPCSKIVLHSTEED